MVIGYVGDTGTVTFVDGVPGLTVDVYVTGGPTLEAFEPGTVTDPLELPAGSYDVEIFPAGADPDSEDPVISGSADLEAGANVSLVAHLDAEGAKLLHEVFERADAFLFGRRTYELFAGYWGVMDPGSGPIADALNTRPKYVASTTLTDPRWANTTVLSGDVAAAVGELKAKPGGELQVHGSGDLVRWLLDNDLVDEITLLTYPVVIGQGACIGANAVIEGPVYIGPYAVIKPLSHIRPGTSIGHARPIGGRVCGSGILDTMALLVESGLADSSGRLSSPDEARENGSVPPALLALLDETGGGSGPPSRRLRLGTEARHLGYGGIRFVAAATGAAAPPPLPPPWAKAW